MVPGAAKTSCFEQCHNSGAVWTPSSQPGKQELKSAFHRAGLQASSQVWLGVTDQQGVCSRYSLSAGSHWQPPSISVLFGRGRKGDWEPPLNNSCHSDRQYVIYIKPSSARSKRLLCYCPQLPETTQADSKIENTKEFLLLKQTAFLFGSLTKFLRQKTLPGTRWHPRSFPWGCWAPKHLPGLEKICSKYLWHWRSKIPSLGWFTLLETQTQLPESPRKQHCHSISHNLLKLLAACSDQQKHRETIFKSSLYSRFSCTNDFDFLEQSLEEKWILFYHANVNAKMRTKIKLQVVRRRKKRIEVVLESSLFPREINVANVFPFFSNISPSTHPPSPPYFFLLQVLVGNQGRYSNVD